MNRRASHGDSFSVTRHGGGGQQKTAAASSSRTSLVAVYHSNRPVWRDHFRATGLAL
jgi:hypothetical protein